MGYRLNMVCLMLKRMHPFSSVNHRAALVWRVPLPAGGLLSPPCSAALPWGSCLALLLERLRPVPVGGVGAGGLGAWTPSRYCVSPRATLFQHARHWIIVMKIENKIFFLDYASCNGLTERCSQPLSQRSLNIYFRLNQVQWQQKK